MGDWHAEWMGLLGACRCFHREEAEGGNSTEFVLFTLHVVGFNHWTPRFALLDQGRGWNLTALPVELGKGTPDCTYFDMPFTAFSRRIPTPFVEPSVRSKSLHLRTHISVNKKDDEGTGGGHELLQ